MKCKDCKCNATTCTKKTCIDKAAAVILAFGDNLYLDDAEASEPEFLKAEK